MIAWMVKVVRRVTEKCYMLIKYFMKYDTYLPSQTTCCPCTTPNLLTTLFTNSSLAEDVTTLSQIPIKFGIEPSRPALSCGSFFLKIYDNREEPRDGPQSSKEQEGRQWFSLVELPDPQEGMGLTTVTSPDNRNGKSPRNAEFSTIVNSTRWPAAGTMPVRKKVQCWARLHWRAKSSWMKAWWMDGVLCREAPAAAVVEDMVIND